MAFQRIPLLRAAISGEFDSGQSAQIMSIRFDPTGVQNIPGTDGYAPDTEDWVTRTPLIIYDYKLQVITDITLAAWQFYCGREEITDSDNWDLDNSTFTENMKQYRLAPGQITNNENQFNSQVVTTLSYKAKRYWSRKHKQYKWARPPIVLSKNKKDVFGLSIANLSNYHDGRSYYAMASVKNWQMMS